MPVRRPFLRPRRRVNPAGNHSLGPVRRTGIRPTGRHVRGRCAAPARHIRGKRAVRRSGCPALFRPRRHPPPPNGRPSALSGRPSALSRYASRLTRCNLRAAASAVWPTAVDARWPALVGMGTDRRGAAAIGCRRSGARVAGAPAVGSGPLRPPIRPRPLPDGELVGRTVPAHFGSIAASALIPHWSGRHQRRNDRTVGRLRFRRSGWRPDGGPAGRGGRPAAARAAGRRLVDAVARIPLARGRRRPFIGGRPHPARFVGAAPPVGTAHGGDPFGPLAVDTVTYV